MPSTGWWPAPFSAAMITNTGMLEIKYWRPFWLHSFWIWYWQAQNCFTKSDLFTSMKPELKISKMDRLGIINKKSVLFPLPYWSEDSFPKWVGWDSRQDIWFYLLGLSSSLHWLVLVLFYALFVQWSILPLKDIFICEFWESKKPYFFWSGWLCRGINSKGIFAQRCNLRKESE